MYTRRAGSDGSMSASGSAGPGFGPRQGRQFSIQAPLGQTTSPVGCVLYSVV